MFKKCIVLLILSPLCLFADSIQSKGIELTTNFWKDAQANNVDRVASYTISGFQGLEEGGIFTKTELLDEIQHASFSPQSFTHFHVTKSGSLLVVTYDLSLIETFNNASINGTAPRMTVWQKIGHNWKLISHVSLAPVTQT